MVDVSNHETRENITVNELLCGRAADETNASVIKFMFHGLMQMTELNRPSLICYCPV